MDFDEMEAASVDGPLDDLMKEAQALASQVGGFVLKRMPLKESEWVIEFCCIDEIIVLLSDYDFLVQTRIVGDRAGAAAEEGYEVHIEALKELEHVEAAFSLCRDIVQGINKLVIGLETGTGERLMMWILYDMFNFGDELELHFFFFFKSLKIKVTNWLFP